MNDARYYRIDYPDALAAWDAYEKACAAIQADFQAFADKYANAKPVFASSVHGLRFHGLRFTPALSSPLWTIAVEREGYIQRPRGALPKSFKGDRKTANAELNQLRHDWKANMPESDRDKGASLDRFWSAIGTDWGNLLFTGIERLRYEGAIYICTGAKLDPRAVEITGGEYLKAKGGAA